MCLPTQLRSDEYLKILLVQTENELYATTIRYFIYNFISNNN